MPKRIMFRPSIITPPPMLSKKMINQRIMKINNNINRNINKIGKNIKRKIK